MALKLICGDRVVKYTSLYSNDFWPRFFTRSDLFMTDLSSANLSRARLGGAVVDKNTKFQGTNMCGAKFYGDFDFKGAGIFGAILLGVEFIGSKHPCEQLNPASSWEHSIKPGVWCKNPKDAAGSWKNSQGRMQYLL